MKNLEKREESGLLLNGVSKTNKKRGFHVMLLGILGASLLGNLLTGKGAVATSRGLGAVRAGEGTVRASQDFLWRLIL